MKLQKKLVLLLAVIFIAASTPLLMGTPFNNYEEYNYNLLKEIASKKGFARVIVKMDVPGIEDLTAYSTSFKTGNSAGDYAIKQAAFDADLALDDAISMTRNTMLHRLNGMPYKINRTFSTLPCVALTVPQETLEKLKSLPEVLRIEEDNRIPLPKTERTEADNGKNGVDRPLLNDTTDIIGADVAWGFGYTGQGWYVAILDTGIRTSHEMFQGKDIVEHCFSLGENWYDTENGGCPNGGTEMDGPGSAAHYEGRFGHGSHVAGIAAGDSHDTYFGVARGSDIIAVNVFTYFPDEDEVYSWNSDVLRGLEYVYTLRNTYNIAAANLSLGSATGYSSYCGDALRADIIANLRAAGIATAVSSGNESRCGAVADPACVPGAVTVNATTKSDEEYREGNWHDEMVDLMAPGTYVNSASGQNDNGYNTRSGTSMAAPHVAGAWAVLKSYDGNLSIDEILTTLQESGTMISSSRCQGFEPKPRINLGDAIMSFFSILPPLNLTAEQFTNQSFLQREYINELTWESNPLNADKNITHYRLYIVGTGGQLNLLAEVDSSTFNYRHRGVNFEEPLTYAVTAVDNQGEEGSPFYHTIQF